MGMANTNQIYARLTTAGGVATSSYAAGVAYAYSNNSKTDWFLPSKAELNELCKYAKTQTTGVTGTDCAETTTMRSGFSTDREYWSSSEDSVYINAGISQDFYYAYRGAVYKTVAWYVRPVRAF